MDLLSDSQVAGILRLATFWACCFVLWATLYVASTRRIKSVYPTINEKKSWFNRDEKVEYISNACQLLMNGMAKFKGPFNLNTEFKPCLMISPEHIDAVNAEPGLSMNAYVEETTLTRFDTFRPLRTPPPGLFEEALLEGLTRNLRINTQSESPRIARLIYATA